MDRDNQTDGAIRFAAGSWDAAYRHLSDGVIVLKRDGVVLYGNPAAEKALCPDGTGLAGRVLESVIPASAVFSEGDVCRVALFDFVLTFHVCAPSSDAWYESVAQPVILNDGTEAYTLFFTIRSATPSLDNPEEILRRMNLMSAIADNLPLGVYVQNADNGFRFISGNRHFTQLFRLDPSGLRGKVPADFLPEPVAARWRSFSETTVLNGGKPQTFQLQMLDDKGFPQFVHFTESLYVDLSGRRLILGSAEDVSAEVFFHKYEAANAEILRRTQQETDFDTVLSIITEIVFREFDSCRMVRTNRELDVQKDFVRPDMAETLPKLTPELREKLVGYMRPILKEKHACAIPEIAHIPELAAISEQCPGYPRC